MTYKTSGDSPSKICWKVGEIVALTCTSSSYEEADGVINWGCLRGFPSLLNKRITLLISDPSKGRSSVGTYQIA